MKNLFLLIIILIINCCKGEQKEKFSDISLDNNISQNKPNNPNFISIDEALVGKEILNTTKEKLVIIYKKALERDFERPYMWDAFLAENENLIKFYSYKDYIINNQSFNSFCIKIKYEDAKYEAILLVSKNLDAAINDQSSIVVYENLYSEELYKRFSNVDKTNILNIVLEKSKKESKRYQYLIDKNMFLDYFIKNNEKVNKNWDKNESNTYEYQEKGEVRNHLKNGHWEEKRYSFEYNTSIWMDGDYNNGLRNKEWNISPNGPVEKIREYHNGSVVRISTP
ncbi:MAG: hypothetical protein LBE92_18970 [Chryseobacterium sp.]|jgi:hypothetical protein|uniref:hypothetical protein n=1 Tax=Chryseobacterium sp. TaxID=1871047 RepID=UPI00282D0924|nr:hypothetical protein [Chryseobacterium sp.]MDR2238212.1 hypothetical protein [Chryseobacterium sp.]